MQKSSRLIVFLIPPDKLVNGGIMSIFSIAKVSRQFEAIHKAEVVIATYPGTKSYHRNDLFENSETILAFDEVMRRGAPDYLLLHIPEYASYNTFMTLQAPKYQHYLQEIKDLHVNIMNQNMLLMQQPSEVAQWFALTTRVTQTTAHIKYTSQEIADDFCLPTHYFSTWVDQSQYDRRPYEQKENLIALSHDFTPLKDRIVKQLETELPDYKIITIQNMTYEQYKATISRAKFTVTFGEGFDGYYNESVLSGGITFAVYNDKFFPGPEYKQFENVYASYDDMLAYITDDIRRLDNASAYNKVSRLNTKKTNSLYSFDAYTENIRKFYLSQYTYLPSAAAFPRLLSTIESDKLQVIVAKNSLLADRDIAITGMETMIADKSNHITQLDTKIADMEQSASWRLTQPLRNISARLK